MRDQATPNVERESGVNAHKACNELAFEGVDGLLGWAPEVIVWEDEFKGDVAALEKKIEGLRDFVVEFLYEGLVTMNCEELEELTINGDKVALGKGFKG